MFGINRKLEEKEQEMERALSSKQDEIDQYAQKLAEAKEKMQAAWQQTESHVVSIEDCQKGLAERMRELAKSVNEAGGKAKRQNEKIRDLQRQAEKLAKDAEKSESSGQKNLARIQCQEKEVLEIAKQYEDVVSPGEIIHPVAASIRKEIEQMQGQVEGLEELGKQMEMRALHAAIEAGRMGEAGLDFVGAAEEVRVLSGQYSWAAAFLTDKMKRILSELQEMEEQTGQLAELLRKQNARLERAVSEVSGYVGELEAPSVSLVIAGVKELAGEIGEAGKSGKEIVEECSQAASGIEKEGKEYGQRNRKALRDLRGQVKEAKEAVRG